jgi:hypothetical protein
MCIEWLIPKATKTHLEYVIIITFHFHNVARTGLNVTLLVYCLSYCFMSWRYTDEVEQIRRRGTKLSDHISIPLSALRKLRNLACEVTLCGPQEYSRSESVDKTLRT